MARSFDSKSIVAKKNNVSNAQLKMELNRIAREEVIEIRMHNVAKQRFKHKFAKLDVFAEKNGNEPCDVVMYQSHNPGFCYRRNGECRAVQSNITNLSVDFQDIRKLVFTDNDIDIEKVLFLYLLSTHRTNTLSPPPRSQKTSFLTREQSPLERLIDRSKKRQCTMYLPKNLPLFIIELQAHQTSKPPIQDSRLVGKVIINEKIMQLVHSVMVALKSANTERYEEMISLGRDVSAFKDIARLNRMCRFIRMLEGQNLISSCESFYLISPTAKHNVHTLVIQQHFPILEKLILNIRRNIFIIPSTNTFNEVTCPGDSSMEDDVPQITNDSNKFLLGMSIVSSCPSEEILKVNAEPDLTLIQDELKSNLGLSSNILPRKRDKFAFKAHEIVSNMNIICNSDDDFNESYQRGSFCSAPDVNLDLEKIATMLNQKVQKANKRDQEQLQCDLALLDDDARMNSLLCRPGPLKDTDNKCDTVSATKFSIRKTLCEACKVKWKTPLPAPKISKLNKIRVPQFLDRSIATISSPSSLQLSIIIDDEYKRWGDNYSRFSTNSEQYTNKMYKSMARGSFINHNSIELVHIDELHLAKIRQEIKENETRRRLDNFLNS